MFGNLNWFEVTALYLLALAIVLSVCSMIADKIVDRDTTRYADQWRADYETHRTTIIPLDD